jgi:hypothetical protein
MKLGLGRYYITSIRGNCITHHHVDLEELGSELGVFGPGEKLEEKVTQRVNAAEFK